MSFVAHNARVNALRLSGRLEESCVAVREALAVSGRVAYAARAQHEYVQCSDLGAAALGAGRLDEACSHMARAATEGEPRVIVANMEHWPDWRALSRHSCYDELMTRVGWKGSL
jgi:hypothetical protein